MSDPLIGLIKKIDAVTGTYDKEGAGSAVVFLNSLDKGINERLKEIADREKIRHTILSTTIPEGPKGYNLPYEASVTVVLYVDYTVKATYGWRRNELKDGDCDEVLTAFAKILK